MNCKTTKDRRRKRLSAEWPIRFILIIYQQNIYFVEGIKQIRFVLSVENGTTI